MKNALCIDPGTRTGFALVKEGEVGASWAGGHLPPMEMLAFLECLYQDHGVHTLVVEDQFMGVNVKAMINTRDKAIRWVALAESLCWEIEWVHPSKWQCFWQVDARRTKTKGRKHKQCIQKIASLIAQRNLEPDECDAYLIARYWIENQKQGV